MDNSLSLALSVQVSLLPVTVIITDFNIFYGLGRVEYNSSEVTLETSTEESDEPTLYHLRPSQHV
jgi:hypothetical protein